MKKTLTELEDQLKKSRQKSSELEAALAEARETEADAAKAARVLRQREAMPELAKFVKDAQDALQKCVQFAKEHELNFDLFIANGEWYRGNPDSVGDYDEYSGRMGWLSSSDKDC